MKTKEELETIATIIPDLSYYQVLKVSKVASLEEIREAFHREALEFHPDQYTRPEDKELRALAQRIYSVIIKAYQTLTQPSGRTNYDRKITGETPAPAEDENAITGVQHKEDSKKPNFPGKRFYELAHKAFLAKNMNAAKMNIQIAIGAEPDNRQYQELLRRIDAANPPKK